jgi:hypothetical protein
VLLGSITLDDVHQVFKLCSSNLFLGASCFIEKLPKHDVPAISRELTELIRARELGALPPFQRCDEHFQVGRILVSKRRWWWNCE